MTADGWSFVVSGEPVAQPRPRVGRDRAGNVRSYRQTKHPIHAFKQHVAVRARAAGVKRLAGPVAVDLVFCFDRPKKFTKRLVVAQGVPKATLPDLDNLAKGVLDALNGLAWRDDGQVALLRPRKLLVSPQEGPSTSVTIRPLASALDAIYVEAIWAAEQKREPQQ